MIRFLYFLILLSVLSCSGIDVRKPEPEKKRESIFGGPLTYSTDTGSFSAGSTGLPNLSNAKNNSKSETATKSASSSTYVSIEGLTCPKCDSDMITKAGPRKKKCEVCRHQWV